MTNENEYKNWTVRSTLRVPPGDVDGDITVLVHDVAFGHLPADARGMVTSADTVDGTVSVTFTLLDSTRDFAQSVADEMLEYLEDQVPAATGHEVTELTAA